MLIIEQKVAKRQTCDASKAQSRNKTPTNKMKTSEIKFEALDHIYQELKQKKLLTKEIKKIFQKHITASQKPETKY